MHTSAISLGLSWPNSKCAREARSVSSITWDKGTLKHVGVNYT